MTMQYVACNLCGADSTRGIAAHNGFHVVECTECRLVYVNPRPSPQALVALYRDYHQRGGKDESSWGRLMSLNFKQASSLLNELFPERGTLLDVGCGYGHFVARMRRFGWTAAGIDPSPRTVASARARGLDVSESTLDDCAFPRRSFDAITAFYVLEHLVDPLQSLTTISSLLKPGGVVVLRVPHTTPLVTMLSLLGIKNNLYDLPFHLYDFSPGTLKLLLEKAGFTSIRITPGKPTLPQGAGERTISLLSGLASQALYSLSRGSLLLPGTSKTAIAAKPIEDGAGAP